MTPARKQAILLIGFLLVATATTVGAVTSFTRNGLISVKVHEQDGTNINLHIPSAAVWAALPFIPDRAFQHGPRAAEEWSPLAREVLDELSDCEDFSLVSVESQDETVKITKRDDNLVIRVHDQGSDVEVTLPLGTAKLVLRRLEDAQGV